MMRNGMGGRSSDADMGSSAKSKPMWRSPRLGLFYCFLLTGIGLDIYFNWYSFYFDAACAESGNSVPPTYVIFTVLSAIPAAISIILGRNQIYVGVCLVIWAAYCCFLLLMLVEERRTEWMYGVNCYRRIGDASVVAVLVTGAFAAAVVVTTFGGGMVILASRLFRRARRS